MLLSIVKQELLQVAVLCESQPMEDHPLVIENGIEKYLHPGDHQRLPGSDCY